MRAEGGSDPKDFWAAWPRKSGVAPAHSCVCSTANVCFRRASIFQVSNKLLAPKGEGLGNFRRAEKNFYLLHSLFSSLSALAVQHVANTRHSGAETNGGR
jgi:hypothetical protein